MDWAAWLVRTGPTQPIAGSEIWSYKLDAKLYNVSFFAIRLLIKIQDECFHSKVYNTSYSQSYTVVVVPTACESSTCLWIIILPYFTKNAWYYWWCWTVHWRRSTTSGRIPCVSSSVSTPTSTTRKMIGSTDCFTLFQLRDLLPRLMPSSRSLHYSRIHKQTIYKGINNCVLFVHFSLVFQGMFTNLLTPEHINKQCNGIYSCELFMHVTHHVFQDMLTNLLLFSLIAGYYFKFWYICRIYLVVLQLGYV